MLSTNGLINWDSIIEEILVKQGSIRHIDQTIDDNKTNLRTYNDLIKEKKIPYEYSRKPFINMVKGFYQAKYDFKKITFQNYYPRDHFSNIIIKDFEKIVNVSVQESWISKVDPYQSVPFHSDEYDKEIEWNQKKLVRYMAFITEPIKKQVFVVGDTYYENVEKHTIVKWSTPKDTHALINCSDRPNFLFHFLGYEND
jgi:hypothetical protein